MTTLDAMRERATAPVDFQAWLMGLRKFLLGLLVVLIAGVPFAVAWSVTMVARLWVAAVREGVRQASRQIGPEGS